MSSFSCPVLAEAVLSLGLTLSEDQANGILSPFVATEFPALAGARGGIANPCLLPDLLGHR